MIIALVNALHTEGNSIMNINYDLNPLIIFVTTIGISVVLFTIIRLILDMLYSTTLVNWSWFKHYLEKTQGKGLPLIAKYGSIGLLAFVAIPIPATGVCAATLLSWLIGMKWHISLLTILPGVAISNGIVMLSTLGIIQGINQLAC